jgi:hypothetical protein
MTDDKRLDESISRLVRGIHMDIPSSLEEELCRRSAALKPLSIRPAYRRLLWTLLPSGAALILGVLLLMRAPIKLLPQEIAEIRTQFEIADKNITIVFIQKPDFVFYEEN